MDISQYRPKGKIEHKHLVSLNDCSPQDIFEILLTGVKLKHLHKKGKRLNYLKYKTLAMIFSKSSTRTRVSFEQAIKQLGGTAMVLSSSELQLGRGETIHDTAKTLSRYNIDGVMIRTFKHDDVLELAKHGDFSVINGLTDDEHPCQALADLMTIYEVFGRLKGIKLVYCGDANNVLNSLMVGGAKAGLEVVCACPEGYSPEEKYLAEAQKWGNVTVNHNVKEAVEGADVVYTDVFFSMGQEMDQKKAEALAPYQVTQDIMKLAAKSAIFMHCLPAHRGQEVTDEVMDSPCSVVFEQAENRLHVQKAILSLLMR